MNTILIIESDRLFKENLIELLEFEGYKATGVANALEAEMSLNKQKPAIIICDETSMNGSFVKFKEELKKAGKNSSIVIMNSDGTNENYKGADLYLKLPFKDEELFTKLSKLNIKPKTGN